MTYRLIDLLTYRLNKKTTLRWS